MDGGAGKTGCGRGRITGPSGGLKTHPTARGTGFEQVGGKDRLVLHAQAIQVYPMKALYFSLLYSALLTPIQGLSAESQTPTCPVIWDNTIQSIAPITSKTPSENKVILFSDFDGQLYNCLAYDIPEKALASQQFWKTALSRLFSDPTQYTQKTRPDFCNSSYSQFDSLTFMTITLPMDPETYNSTRCQTNLKGLSDRVETFLQKD
ncbi:MAG: hypothetical protein N4A53_13930 [Pelagimonas sp.]|nr:hypothetical protein [Pelagimonas sp.]